MSSETTTGQIYEGEGDRLMEEISLGEKLILLPDARPSRQADITPRMRIQWGQHLLDDLVAGRYRSLVCAVNADDNSHGIIGQLANLLPTCQWSDESITRHARMFHSPHVSVVKYDMDMLEVLALLRPEGQDHLSLDDISKGFRMVSEMIRRRPQRMPSASVCFLGAHANQLHDADGREPSFETVLRLMHEGGYCGDIYPALWMWESAPTAVYARYPFPPSLDAMREGGF